MFHTVSGTNSNGKSTKQSTSASHKIAKRSKSPEPQSPTLRKSIYKQLNSWLSDVGKSRQSNGNAVYLDVDWDLAKTHELVDDVRMASVQRMFIGETQWMDEKLEDAPDEEDLTNAERAELYAARKERFNNFAEHYTHMPTFRPHTGMQKLPHYVLNIVPQFTQLTALDLHCCRVSVEDLHNKLAEGVAAWRHTLKFLVSLF